MAAHDSPLLGDADAGDLDELLKLHVKEAIRSKSQKGGLRRASSYNNLVEQIRRIKEKALGTKDEEQVEYLTSVLDALTSCVSSLHEREHESLLNEIFGISIWQATPELRAALLRLVTHLVVANSALMPLCLRVLAMGLQPPPTPPTEQQSTASGAHSQEWRPPPELVEIQGQVIAALEKVLRLVPTAPSRLVAVIAGGIPHRLRDCDTQCLYLRGALALAEAPAAAAVREGILAAAAEHLLSLDVEIRWQDIAAADADADEEEEAESEQEEEDIFELEGQTEHLHIGTPRESAQAPERLRGRGGWEGAAGGANAEASPSGRQPTTESAEKLDALMGLVFEHLGRRCEAGQLQAAWNTSLHTFQRTILHTHRSKFTQYLLWYLCEKDPKHCSASLVQLLLGQLTSPNTAPITRSAAAAYVASFLARAAMVPEDTLIGALQRMARWCLAYCQEQDARDARTAAAVTPLTTRLDMDAGPPRGIQHQVFYAACQGLLYVLCYRLEQLMEAPAAAAGTSPADTDAGAGVQVIRQLFTDVMPKLLHHRLAPLAVCLPTVVAEFTRLAQRLNLMDCTALLPGRLEAARAQRPLEMFFPFDPFLLRHSAQHLDLGRTYVHWKAGHPSQAAANPADGDASDMSSDEEVEGVSETDDDDDRASSSDEESGSSSDSDSSDELEDDSSGVQRRRQPLAPKASNAPLWPHAPIGMRPISAGASRKRPASSTPGSDQGFLHGASFDTNGGMSPLEGSSPGAHPSISPMSWVQSFEGNRLMNRHVQPLVVHTAE
ncbi:g7552 [Coccomyxa elongata]